MVERGGGRCVIRSQAIRITRFTFPFTVRITFSFSDKWKDKRINLQRRATSSICALYFLILIFNHVHIHTYMDNVSLVSTVNNISSVWFSLTQWFHPQSPIHNKERKLLRRATPSICSIYVLILAFNHVHIHTYMDNISLVWFLLTQQFHPQSLEHFTTRKETY
jgi:hypothetical protein